MMTVVEKVDSENPPLIIYKRRAQKSETPLKVKKAYKKRFRKKGIKPERELKNRLNTSQKKNKIAEAEYFNSFTAEKRISIIMKYLSKGSFK